MQGKSILLSADDIADSFDYTNKYAIIEYLDELSENPLIDVLILTHNFDFYRTVSKHLGIGYDMLFVVQKNGDGSLIMEEFTYKNDYFKKGILDEIRNGQIEDESGLKKAIAAIPFCRNIKMNQDQIKDIQTNVTVSAREWIFLRNTLTKEQLEIVREARNRLQ